jgi:hypothetical protein
MASALAAFALLHICASPASIALKRERCTQRADRMHGNAAM